MDSASLQQGGNELLKVLSPETLARLAPHCRRIALVKGTLICDADQPIEAALFVEHGFASVSRPGDPATEIGLIGRESFCGTPLALECDDWPYRAVVQSDQLTGIQIGAEAFKGLMAGDVGFRRAVLRSIHVAMIQLAEGLLSNADQRLIQRIARRLLMYRDRLQSDRLELTHEYMALVIGAQRTGVTSALHEMEAAGVVACKRGVVTISNLSALQDMAADGYGEAESQHSKLFSPILSA